jgi:hypothetical protein
VVAVGDRIRIIRPVGIAGKLAVVIGIVDGFDDGGALIEVRFDDGGQGVLVLPIDTFESVDTKGDQE